MKKYLLTSTLLCLGFLAYSQSDLTNFNQQRLQKQKRAMTVLGAWAIGNMAAGGILQGQREGSDKYFHQMNIGWNAVNLTLAGFGYWSALQADPGSFDLTQTIQVQHRFQKILLFNAGLDVGYMLGGAYLMERSKNLDTSKNPDRLYGFGKSIVLQGAFLFLFDLGACWYMASANGQLEPLIGETGIGLRLTF